MHCWCKVKLTVWKRGTAGSDRQVVLSLDVTQLDSNESEVQRCWSRQVVWLNWLGTPYYSGGAGSYLAMWLSTRRSSTPIYRDTRHHRLHPCHQDHHYYHQRRLPDLIIKHLKRIDSGTETWTIYVWYLRILILKTRAKCQNNGIFAIHLIKLPNLFFWSTFWKSWSWQKCWSVSSMSRSQRTSFVTRQSGR